MTPLDINLQLADAASPTTTTANGTAVNTEGGFYALVVFKFGDTITDANETWDFLVQASINNGSNYYQIGAMRQIVDGDEDLVKSIVVYVPRFTPSATYVNTKVRLAWTAAGTSPSVELDCWLVPLLSLAPPAIDEALKNGIAELS